MNGGCTFQGKYLGRIVRYYHSTTSEYSLQYEKNGNKVPKSQDCKPLVDLVFPDDLDREWYRQEFLKAWSNETTAKKSKKEKV